MAKLKVHLSRVMAEMNSGPTTLIAHTTQIQNGETGFVQKHSCAPEKLQRTVQARGQHRTPMQDPEPAQLHTDKIRVPARSR